MKSIVLFALLAIAVPLNALAQDKDAKTKPVSDKPGVEQRITQLDLDLMNAMVRKDRSLSDRVELDNYVFINPGGGVEEGRPPAGEGGPTFESAETTDVRVRVNGDVAVLTGRATIKGRLANGTNISGPYRYMRVFIKQKGEWKLAAASAVPIGNPPAQTSKN